MQIPRRLTPTISSLAIVAGTVFGVNAATQLNARAASVAPQSAIITCGFHGCGHRHFSHHCWSSCGGGWSSWSSSWSSWDDDDDDDWGWDWDDD